MTYLFIHDRPKPAKVPAKKHTKQILLNYLTNIETSFLDNTAHLYLYVLIQFHSYVFVQSAYAPVMVNVFGQFTLYEFI